MLAWPVVLYWFLDGLWNEGELIEPAGTDRARLTGSKMLEVLDN